MEDAPYVLDYYYTAPAACPFTDWFASLDNTVQRVVDARLARVRRGLLGDVEPVGAGVYELKIDFGAGLRVYFGRYGRINVVLLCGGDKSRQQTDITKAQAYWQAHLRRMRP